MTRPAYPGFQVTGPRDGREAARIVNNILAGKLNVVLEFDVPDAANTVEIADPRLSELTVFLPPLGSSVTSIALHGEGLATVNVVPGPARTERLVALG